MDFISTNRNATLTDGYDRNGLMQFASTGLFLVLNKHLKCYVELLYNADIALAVKVGVIHCL